jgi:hypothetical protein
MKADPPDIEPETTQEGASCRRTEARNATVWTIKGDGANNGNCTTFPSAGRSDLFVAPLSAPRTFQRSNGIARCRAFLFLLLVPEALDLVCVAEGPTDSEEASSVRRSAAAF